MSMPPRPFRVAVRQPSVVFAAVILAFGMYVFVDSFSYQISTSLFARLVSAVFVLLAMAVLVREVRMELASTAPGRDALEDFERAAEQGLVGGAAAVKEKHGFGAALLWFGTFFAGIALLGHVLALPAWTFIYLRWNRAPVVTCLVLAAAVWAITQLLLLDRFGMLLFDGMLFGARLPRLF